MASGRDRLNRFVELFRIVDDDLLDVGSHRFRVQIDERLLHVQA